MKRTGATDLTDEELVLLDILFDGNTSFELLTKGGFEEQWNYPSHRLDDRQLKKTLDRFCQDGILRTSRAIGRTCYGLTPLGGRLWESERTPVWDRYATDRYDTTASGRRMITLCATTPQVRDEFWLIGSEARLWPTARARVRLHRITNHVLIPWKRFPAVYVAVGIVDDEETAWPPDSWTDWSLYHDCRTWWREVSELQKFVSPVGENKPAE